MIRLKKFLYLLDIDTPVIILETETELYRGASGTCPKSVLDNAYVKEHNIQTHFRDILSILDICKYERK